MIIALGQTIPLLQREANMSKEIETKTCNYCESRYKLVYDLSESSGYAKFCPFCGSDAYDEEPEDEEDE